VFNLAHSVFHLVALSDGASSNAASTIRRARGSRFAVPAGVVMIRLTRKLADAVDGVDLSKRRVGQVLHLPRRDAWLLIAEGWAERVEKAPQARSPSYRRNFG